MFSLYPGGTQQINAGLAAQPVVSGEVWDDSNGDGLLNNNESGMSGVVVNLDNSAGQVLMTTTTEDNGDYAFSVPPSVLNQGSGLGSGSGSGSGSGFEIQVVSPSGSVPTLENVQGSGLNSNINSSGYSNPFGLAPGGTQQVNAGLAPPAVVSGEVWYDSNDDGLLNDGESGLQGITVNLANSAGQVLFTTTTDENGDYEFDLSPAQLNQGSGSGSGGSSGSGGGYEIQVVIPAGDTATIENASGSGINSNINSSGYSNVFNLTPGASQQVNAGIVPQSGSGSGSAVVSGEMWFDYDGDGLLDNGEVGMPEFTVDLDSAQGQVLMTTTTDVNGNYQFNISASLLSQYNNAYVHFGIPSGDTATAENVNGSGINSNIDEAGNTAVFALAADIPVRRVAGIVPLPNNDDVLVWNPQNGSTISAYASNWYDKTQGKQGITAPNITNIVYFDGTKNSKTSSNSPIEWYMPNFGNNIKYRAAEINLQNGYTAQMTIDSGVTVYDAGFIFLDDSSWLKIDFGNNSQFLINGDGGTITNMVLSGSRSGIFEITGGTTYIGVGAYTDKIGVQFYIAPEAKLRDESLCTLTFTNNNIQISVLGTMTVFNSQNGSTLIDATGYDDDYIYVTDDGLLNYFGNGVVVDTFAIPVLVDNGDFILHSQNNAPAGAKLIVQGVVANQANTASVYVNGGTVQLSNGATLECDSDYYQDAGTLETTDGTTCTLQDGAAGAGTATIAGGSLIIAQDATDYGELDVNASTLNFAGQYAAGIEGDVSESRDLLNVRGVMNIQNTAYLSINVFGPLEANNEWTIIKSTQQLQTFGLNSNEIALGLKEAVTKSYVLKS